MNQEDTYNKYLKLTAKAIAVGHSTDQIIAELRHEQNDIRERCRAKMAELMFNKSPYPRREAQRAAMECTAVIDRLCKELEAKEITA